MNEPTGLAEFLPPRPFPDRVVEPGFAFLDVEASSLEDNSYPVEVGVSDDALRTKGWLVRPVAGWGSSGWSDSSETVHGIAREDLDLHGMPPADVAEALNRELSGRMVFSDAPDFDSFWLDRLFEAAGVPRRFQVLPEADALATYLRKEPGFDPNKLARRLGSAMETAATLFPHVHHAEHDARHMAAQFRMTVDLAYLTSALTYAAEFGSVAGTFRNVERRFGPS